MEYSIFISYRRIGGFETAKHLYDLLKYDGYTVCFDIDTLREGKFNSALLSCIESCEDFILIVDAHAFDRTLNPNFNPENDWLRQELSYALKLKKNIIPILLSGASFPEELPDDIKDIRYMNGPEYSKGYFDSFYSKLISFLHSTPVVSRQLDVMNNNGEKLQDNNPAKVSNFDLDEQRVIDSVALRELKEEFKRYIKDQAGTIKEYAIIAVSLICFACIIVFVYYKFCQPASLQRVMLPCQRPHHGSILARDSTVLARDVDSYDLFLLSELDKDDPDIDNAMRVLAQKLSLIKPSLSAPEWWTRLNNLVRLHYDMHSVLVASNFTKEEVSFLNSDCFYIDTLGSYRNNIDLNLYNGTGIGFFQHKYVREYPYGSLARRAIGYVKYLEKTLYIGLDGEYDERLAYNNVDMLTTLDMEIQALADNALRSKLDSSVLGACLVLMEVQTGAVRAMVNLHKADDGRFREQYNYAVSRSYEPGYVVSAMTLATALQDNIITSLDETMPTCGGCYEGMPVDLAIREYEKLSGEKNISIIEGFKMSSNYVMTSLASRYENNPDYYIGSLRDLCATYFDTGGLALVDFPSPKSFVWTKSTIPSFAIGYAWTTSPLHIINFYNTVANGGVEMNPYLVSEFIGTIDDGIIQHKPLNNNMTPEVAAEVARALKASCDSRPFVDAKFQVAGKSSVSRQIIDRKFRINDDPYTGENNSHEYASTFAGFFPADVPQYSVVCAVFTNLTSEMPSCLNAPGLAVREIVDSISMDINGLE
ncbi:MAG: penicillin-binding transpeptidase domain-containing protein [Candidatus Cryptobacteroides sp.]